MFSLNFCTIIGIFSINYETPLRLYLFLNVFYGDMLYMVSRNSYYMESPMRCRLLIVKSLPCSLWFICFLLMRPQITIIQPITYSGAYILIVLSLIFIISPKNDIMIIMGSGLLPTMKYIQL